MVLPGLVLVACGVALRIWGHGGVVQGLGIASLIVGWVAVVVGVVLRVRRRARKLRYVDTDSFPGGIPPDYRTSRAKIAAMVVVLAYLFSPIDLAVLELLLPVGVAGDAGAFAWLTVAVGKELSRHHRARLARRSVVRRAGLGGAGGLRGG